MAFQKIANLIAFQGYLSVELALLICVIDAAGWVWCKVNGMQKH